MKNYKGFTITELLIALGVIAVLTTIMLPIVHSLMPNQNTLMAKRAFYTTETIINGMINNNGCYPPLRNKTGFDDGAGYKKCQLWNDEKPDNADKKFLKMFLDKLDIKNKISDNEIETKDGMFWNFQTLNFGGGDSAILIIDVNGKSKGPNCAHYGESELCAGRKKGFDKFTIEIMPSGKIKIHDCWADRAVRIDKKLVNDTDNSCEE